MDDFNKTLKNLMEKYGSFSNRQKSNLLDTLKTFIKQSEETPVHEDQEIESVINHSPLKLTIKKNKMQQFLFNCDECWSKFGTMKKMISHVVNNHKEAEVTCQACKGTFHSSSLINIHECFHSSQTTFIQRKCGVCDKIFFGKREFESHMKNDHNVQVTKFIKLFACSYCSSTFKLRSQMLVHEVQKHKEQSNKKKKSKFDPLENEYLNSSRSLISKKKRKNKKELKNSFLPEYSSTDEKSREPILPSHSDRKYYINSDKEIKKMKTIGKEFCDICKQFFLTKKALDKHIMSYNHKSRAGELEIVKQYFCDNCDQTFSKISDLQRHMSSHHTNLSHRCNICDYRTSEKCNLAEHMRRHYQIRNFICEFCKASFIAKRELSDHISFKHSSIRSFECTECGKMFKTRRILTRHIKTHMDIRPCVCACGSSFLRLTNLRRHMVRVHRDNNPLVTRVVNTDETKRQNNKSHKQRRKPKIPDKNNEENKIIPRIKNVWFADSDLIEKKAMSINSVRTQMLEQLSNFYKDYDDDDDDDVNDDIEDDNNDSNNTMTNNYRSKKPNDNNLNFNRRNKLLNVSNNIKNNYLDNDYELCVKNVDVDDIDFHAVRVLDVHMECIVDGELQVTMDTDDEDDDVDDDDDNDDDNIIKERDEDDEDEDVKEMNDNVIDDVDDTGVVRNSVDVMSHNSNSVHKNNDQDHAMDICDLVASPEHTEKSVTDLGSYKVDNIIMESDARIWRPMDSVVNHHHHHSGPDSDHVLDVYSSTTSSNPLNHHHHGLISSFNDVFLTASSSTRTTPPPSQHNKQNTIKSCSSSSSSTSSLLINVTKQNTTPNLSIINNTDNNSVVNNPYYTPIISNLDTSTTNTYLDHHQYNTHQYNQHPHHQYPCDYQTHYDLALTDSTANSYRRSTTNNTASCEYHHHHNDGSINNILFNSSSINNNNNGNGTDTTQWLISPTNYNSTIQPTLEHAIHHHHHHHTTPYIHHQRPTILYPTVSNNNENNVNTNGDTLSPIDYLVTDPLLYPNTTTDDKVTISKQESTTTNLQYCYGTTTNPTTNTLNVQIDDVDDDVNGVGFCSAASSANGPFHPHSTSKNFSVINLISSKVVVGAPNNADDNGNSEDSNVINTNTNRVNNNDNNRIIISNVFSTAHQYIPHYDDNLNNDVNEETDHIVHNSNTIVRNKIKDINSDELLYSGVDDDEDDDEEEEEEDDDED